MNHSRYCIGEYDMLNRVNANRKLMNAEELKEERFAKFKESLALVG